MITLEFLYGSLFPRSLYLMALNFSDKQKWVATLEAIITHSPDTPKRKDAVSSTVKFPCHYAV